MPLFTKQNIAIAIAFIFHLSGAIGILFTPYKDWFIANTWLNLLLMFGLILFTHNDGNENKFSNIKNLLLFAAIAYIIGFGAELLGVNKGILFGNYSYGNTMGAKYENVPLIIGLQWFVTVYCCGVIMSFMGKWATRKLKELGEEDKTTKRGHNISLLIDASLLATFFDYIMEPAAQKLGYWQWENNKVPFYNYTCWFFVSALLLFVFTKLQFNKLNRFAIHLFIIQLLFFIAINNLVNS